MIDRAKRHECHPAKCAGMNVTNGPVGIVRQAVDCLDRHDRTFEGRHAIETDSRHHETQDRVGAQFVPCTRKRHQAVNHPTPGRHPQHDRESHAKCLRPIRKCGIVQVVRTGPDIQEDQRPEVNDRQAIGIDRTFSTLRNEIVHHAEEACRQEEANRVVAIPPLRQRILNTREHRVGFGTRERNRYRQVVAQMQHRNRDDEGQIEPVRHIDMRLRTFKQRTDENGKIRDPDHGQPDIDEPFRFCIFTALGNPRDIADCGHHDEQLVAPENKRRKRLATIK